MGWEKRRNGKQYFYTKRRIGCRVVSVYLGGGEGAVVAASQLATKSNDRAQLKHEKSAQLELEKEFIKLETLVLNCIEQRLSKCGYHKHRGEWRKRRSPHAV